MFSEGKETGYSDKHAVQETFRLRINDGGNCLALKNVQSNPSRKTVHNRSQHTVLFRNRTYSLKERSGYEVYIILFLNIPVTLFCTLGKKVRWFSQMWTLVLSVCKQNSQFSSSLQDFNTGQQFQRGVWLSKSQISPPISTLCLVKLLKIPLHLVKHLW